MRINEVFLRQCTAQNSYLFDNLKASAISSIFEDFDSATLTALYFQMRSRKKLVSDLVEDEAEKSTFSEETFSSTIAKMLVALFGENWKRLFEVYKSEYEPAFNYDMTETFSGSNSATSNSTSNAGTMKNDVENSIYGFNSTTAVKNNATSTTDTQTKDASASATGSGTESHSLTRKGNIGVTTTQQLLQSEIDLWRWNFVEQVFSDIDEILTIPIY